MISNKLSLFLGYKTIRAIALSIGVIHAFQQSEAGYSLRQHWMHGAVSACIGRLIAQKVNLKDPEMAFIAGILRKMGLILMVQHAPDEMRGVMALAKEHQLR